MVDWIEDILDIKFYGTRLGAIAGAMLDAVTWIAFLAVVFWVIARWKGII